MPTDELKRSTLEDKRYERLSIFLLFLIVFFWIAVRLAFLTEATGPSVFGDEILYRMYAERILNWQPFHAMDFFTIFKDVDPHFPPAYPFFIAIASLQSLVHPVLMMKYFGILASTLIVFPVYGITRVFVGEWMSLCAAFVSGSFAYHFIFSNLLMSENISVTLGMMAIWIAVRKTSRPKLSAFIFGILIAVSFLTKFIFLVYSPFFYLLFGLAKFLESEKRSNEERIFDTLRALGYSFIGLLVPLIVWLVYASRSGISIKHALGFLPTLVDLGSPPTKEVRIFFIFSILQLFGVLVAASSLFVPVGLFSFRMLGSFKLKDVKFIYVLFAIGFIVSLWVFTAKVMWDYAYFFDPNPSGVWDVPSSSLGERYLIIFLPILLPLCFAAFDFVLKDRVSRRVILATIGCLGVFAAVLWYATRALLLNQPWVLPPGFVGGITSPNVLYIGYGLSAVKICLFSGICLVIAAMVPWLLGSSKYRRLVGQFIVGLFALGVGYFYALGGILPQRGVEKDITLKTYAAHGKKLDEVVRSNEAISRDLTNIYVFFSNSSVSAVETLTNSKFNRDAWPQVLSFWSGKFVTLVSSMDECIKFESLCFIISSDNPKKVGVEFKVENQYFRVYQLQVRGGY